MTKILTALVGSYVQPEWLIDREALRNRLPARIMTGDMWRVAPELLQEAMDDAVRGIGKRCRITFTPSRKTQQSPID